MQRSDVTIPALAACIIALAEGLRLHSYTDSGGVWTIGIGHTKGVVEGMTCTADQAYAWFEEDFATLLSMIDGKPLLEAVALASFGFNCGRGALNKVLSGADSISNPVHTTDARGVVLGGLVNRRRLEQMLILLSDSA